MSVHDAMSLVILFATFLLALLTYIDNNANKK